MKQMKLRQHQFSTQAQTSDLQKPNHPPNNRKDVPNSETKPITLLFDLETTPLDAQKTEIHCIVTLDYETGETTRYNDIGGDEPIVRAVTYLEQADTIIGHNIIGFDIPVIKRYTLSLNRRDVS